MDELLVVLLAMDALDLQNKRVLIREDLNVPIKQGQITNDARIRAACPTLRQALDAKARVMVMSHLGRPQEGAYDASYSLQPVADRLSELLEQNVRLVSDWQQDIPQPGEIVLFENVRMLRGEKANDALLAKQMAACCDVYVMDAFASAHRAHASTHGVAQYAPIACAGPLLIKEVNALQKALAHPQAPTVAIVGGAKVSTKLKVLMSLCQRVDTLIVGGGIANTFLAAQGYPVGQSLYEPDLLDMAKAVVAQAQQSDCALPLPLDVVVASECAEDAQASIKAITEVADSDKILDIGPQTIERYQQILMSARTILWNGPVGVFEIEQFSEGTKALTQTIAQSSAFSVAGGGDTLAAIEAYQVQAQLSYISTGGGAFLEMLEGKILPAITILQNRAKERHQHEQQTSN